MVTVQINNISKSYKEVEALKNVSFSTSKGEIFGIIGPDGAGKTSLLRILVSLLMPDSGTATVLGHDVVKEYKEIRKKVGYMAGRFSLYQDLSVEENLKFYATVFGTTVKENYDLIRDVYIQIEPFKDRLAGKLSGGMKQKLALSCALIHRPELLVLDEPTTGVDAVSRKEFWDLLNRIRENGIGIIVSTPYMDEAFRCDRVALIQKGQFLSISKPSEIHKTFTKPLFEITHSMGSYKLVQELRKFNWCRGAWMFGQSAHLTLKNQEDEPGFISYADKNNLTYRRIKAGMEDTFIELMKEA